MMDLVYFILFLGGLIFFHELGHYLVARAVGVTVVRFSIGFGPRLVGFRRGATEYRISILPLGGYVKFLGDDPDNPLPGEDARRGFLTTDAWRRVLIVIAGPVFNLILPFLIFFPMYAFESRVPPAILGTLARDGPAATAGLKPGDEVTAIDGEEIANWLEMLSVVSESPERPLAFRVRRGGETIEATVTPRAVEISTLTDVGVVETVGRIEVALERGLPVAVVRQGSPADRAGVLDWDAVLAADGREVFDWQDIATALAFAVERPVRLTVAATSPGYGDPDEPVEVVIGPLPAGEDHGLSDAEFVIERVEDGSPAMRAGLKPGDLILEMDGTTYSDWSFMLQAMVRNPSQSRLLSVDRGGDRVEIRVNLENPEWVPGAAVPRYMRLGARNRGASVSPELIENRARLKLAFQRAIGRTGEIMVVTLAGLWGMVTGRVSLREMGGPIMMYEIASSGAKIGLDEYLGRLALVSVGLGVLNLLPIPVLDGGHLLTFLIEALRRKPMGRRGRQILTYVGLAILAMLMALVFANDIQRKWGM